LYLVFFFVIKISFHIKEAQKLSEVIQNWLRNRSTIEFLGLWERLYNPDFNYLEFEVINKEAGRSAVVFGRKFLIRQTHRRCNI